MFKNWLGGFRLIVGSHLHFTKIDCFGVGGRCCNVGIEDKVQ